MPPNADPIASSVWVRPPRSRGGQPTLSRDQIVRAAVDLLDEEGLAGLSMRRLGSRLGAGATSVYWYVQNKDELLDLAIDQIMGEIPLPDPDTDDWRAAATALAGAFRSMILRHTWITALFSRINIGPNALRLTDRIIAVLRTAGFSDAETGYAANLLSAYAIGAALGEAAWRQAVARSGMSAAELEKSIKTYQRGMLDAYPNLKSWQESNIPPDIAGYQEASFRFGLERLLDGLAGFAAAGTRPGRRAPADSPEAP